MFSAGVRMAGAGGCAQLSDDAAAKARARRMPQARTRRFYAGPTQPQETAGISLLCRWIFSTERVWQG